MFDTQRETPRTLDRLWPRLEPLLPDADDRATFRARLDQYLPDLLGLLVELYGSRYDFFWHLEQILGAAARSYAARSADLKILDRQREADLLWYQGERMLGGVCYADLFAGNLAGVRKKMPYFKELGLTYLHLMPLFAQPDGDNDGGYAVSNYREVDPKIGTTAGLAALAADLRENGISLALDFVFNHTADNHDWAKRALAGDPDYQDFYLMFPDRGLPDQYE
ncbi:MAG: amylosucrase, partial [Anaerolineae bacterium]|nr:amylosucrase [Anaerolineae bacterium]